jgi:hypothetical protein
MSKPKEYWNTIAELQRTMAKPQAWRLVQDGPDAFRLFFTYLELTRCEWAHIQTARGETKVYRTVGAALKDIARVQLQAVIYTEFTDGLFS